MKLPLFPQHRVAAFLAHIESLGALLDQSGVPDYVVRLKPGAPLYLMLDVEPERGFVRGKRFIVVKCLQHCVIIRDETGEDCVVPSMKKTFLTRHLQHAVNVVRFQLPVIVAFAATMHTMQGSTCDQLLLDLRHPVFAHGQLYVALSRATSGGHLGYSAISRHSIKSSFVYNP